MMNTTAAADPAVLEERLFPGRNLTALPGGLLADAASAEALAALQARAAQCGIELAVCSAYRSFARQYQIFQDKYEGRRPVLGPDEQPLDLSGMSAADKIRAIVYFSALPGLSRHHLGTDFDVYAPNLLPPGQSLQLTWHEYEPGAYFAPLGEFLDREAAKFGFERPFMQQWGGGLEPWHLSFSRRAEELLAGFRIENWCALYAARREDFVPQVLSFGQENYTVLLCLH